MSTDSMAGRNCNGVQLKRSLQSRHITMIALGGTIGAGLFVGSGAAIESAGPSIVISYIVAGIIVLMVMRMLSEMALSSPGLGSFTEYARLGLGNWAGFTTGWLYWFFWVVVVGIEAIAGAEILQHWINLATWQLGTVLMLIMCGVNLMSTRHYGEFEFWFASVKVGAIVAFIIIAAGYVLGVGRSSAPMFDNLIVHGGFVPTGPASIVTGVATVIFALTGAEIATVAAAEAREPSLAVARLTNSIAWRILVFYIGSTFLIVTVLPWDTVVVGRSPFAQALDVIGVPGAATVMNLVVLTAVLSCLNSGIYVSSRVLFTLSSRREAPASLVALNERRVPVRAILLACAGGYFAVVASIGSPDRIFSFLVNASGVVVLLVYLIICWAYIRMRRRWPPPARDRVWRFPWGSYATIGAMLTVLLTMALSRELAPQLWLSLLSFSIVLGAYFVSVRFRSTDVASLSS